MSIRALLAGFVLLASTTSALAAGPYIGAAGGMTIFHDSDLKNAAGTTATVSYDKGFGFNVSGGYNFDGFRCEGEFGYKKADVDTVGIVSISGGDATFMSYMVNGYYDIKTTEPAITPYIGAGLGLINGELNDNGQKADDNVFGYQVVAGIGFNVNKNVAIDLSYRFQGAASDLKVEGSELSYTSSNLMAGLRYNF